MPNLIHRNEIKRNEHKCNTCVTLILFLFASQYYRFRSKWILINFTRQYKRHYDNLLIVNCRTFVELLVSITFLRIFVQKLLIIMKIVLVLLVAIVAVQVRALRKKKLFAFSIIEFLSTNKLTIFINRLIYLKQHLKVYLKLLLLLLDLMDHRQAA